MALGEGTGENTATLESAANAKIKYTEEKNCMETGLNQEEGPGQEQNSN